MIGEVVLTTVLVVAAALFAAGALKLADVERFGAEIADYGIAGTTVGRALAHVLPLLEVVTAAAIFVPSARPYGAAFGAMLFVVFAAAVALALRSGRTSISCACFGRSSKPVNRAIVARNLAAATVLAAAAGSQPGGALPSLPAVAAATILGALGLLALEGRRVHVLLRPREV